MYIRNWVEKILYIQSHGAVVEDVLGHVAEAGPLAPQDGNLVTRKFGKLVVQGVQGVLVNEAAERFPSVMNERGTVSDRGRRHAGRPCRAQGAAAR
jgi:hypothetical protein